MSEKVLQAWNWTITDGITVESCLFILLLAAASASFPIFVLVHVSVQVTIPSKKTTLQDYLFAIGPGTI